ncbi:uncharacterized protein [Ciconia boyciana]|uniref:uncharacterized protein n=1 Tax=Ciconia boyciana TaxID=52775 RepID=UPI003BA36975
MQGTIGIEGKRSLQLKLNKNYFNASHKIKCLRREAVIKSGTAPTSRCCAPPRFLRHGQLCIYSALTELLPTGETAPAALALPCPARLAGPRAAAVPCPAIAVAGAARAGPRRGGSCRLAGHGGDRRGGFASTEPSHTCVPLPAPRTETRSTPVPRTLPRRPSPRSRGSRRGSRPGGAAPPPPAASAAPGGGPPAPAPALPPGAPAGLRSAPLRRQPAAEAQGRRWHPPPGAGLGSALGAAASSRSRREEEQPGAPAGPGACPPPERGAEDRHIPVPPGAALPTPPPPARPSGAISLRVCFAARARRWTPAAASHPPSTLGNRRRRARTRSCGQPGWKVAATRNGPEPSTAGPSRAGPAQRAATRSPSRWGPAPRPGPRWPGQSDAAPRQLPAAPSPAGPAAKEPTCKVEGNLKLLF